MDEIEDVEVPPERATVEVRADLLHEAATAAEDALLIAGAPIFQRGMSLVIPVSSSVGAADGRQTETACLKTVDNATLRDHLSRVAVFKKYDGRTKAQVYIPPPAEVAALLLSRAGEWRLRRIAGVITTPTMRADGSILIEPGYDQATGLFHIMSPGTDLPGLNIDAHPTRSLALHCLDHLKQLLREFPFKGEVDGAVALSAILCAVTRGAAPIVPLHAFSAPEAGSGKSYLCDVISAFATGNYCPVIAAGRDDEETDKRLVGLLIAGPPIVSIDNVVAPLGSPILCQATERPLITVRPLGSSDLMSIESRAMFLATGNNLKLAGDMVRRALRCELDAERERPETRAFKANPFREVLHNRNVYIAAAMTIVRAYQMSGARLNLPPVQSYDHWSKFVREPLVWLECEDPAKSMESIRADDPERIEFLALAASWHAAFGEEEMTVADVIQAVNKKDGSGEQPASVDDLREAALGIAGIRGALDSRRFGIWLRDHKEKRLSGYQLVPTTMTRNGMRRWKVIGPTRHEREAALTDSEHMEYRAKLASVRRQRQKLRIVESE